MYNKKQLFELLKKVYEDPNLLIIGEQFHIGDGEAVIRTIERFVKNSGKNPGILGFDIRLNNLCKLDETATAQIISDLTEYVKQGGIITASAHMANPLVGDPRKPAWGGCLGEDEDWETMLTEGTDYNKVFTEELDAIADFLEMLKKNGVPVIWRPFHECNGGWFWFSMVQVFRDEENKPIKKVFLKEETFIKAWRYMYDYLTNERGLDNLLWEFSPNMVDIDCPGMTQALYGFPGEYCDLVGFDWYSGGNYEIGRNNTYKDLASTGKPVAVAEWGPAGDILRNPEKGTKQEDLFTSEDLLALIRRMSNDGYSASYLMTWTSPWSINEMTKGDVLMGAEGILGREDVAKML
ncbi:MAG: hypothetical protein IKT56_03450 [Clostridia bacterium]|nr:hypothetical protein [Clostridia bacterium]